MFANRTAAFWLTLLLTAIKLLKAQHHICPYTQFHDAYHAQSDLTASGSTAAAAAAAYSELRYPDYHNNQPYTPALGASGDAISSFLQGMPSGGGHSPLPNSPYPNSPHPNSPHPNSPVMSENTIFKSYFSEPQAPESAKSKCAVPPEKCDNYTLYYYRSIDGSCNNLQYPGYGMARGRYGRLLAPQYGGGAQYAPKTARNGAPLPNARLLSLALYGDELIHDNTYTLTSMQFGQAVGHDLSRLTTEGAPKDCCTDRDNNMCYPIELHPQGPIASGSGKSCIGFSRSVSDVDASCPHNPNYAEKISVVTAYLDMSSVYGNSQEQNYKVREFEGGRLKTSYLNNRHWLPISRDKDECGENSERCYSIPDRRNQFIPSITVLQTIQVREHNHIACALARLNPHYTDEQLYQEARKINIGQYQHIVYYEWLPLLIGGSFAYANRLIYYTQPNEYVNDYDDSVDPAPYAESAAAALRYAHATIPGYFSMVSPDRMYNETKRLSDYFEKPSNIDFLTQEDNFDSVIRGMTTQPQKLADSNIDKEIKHHFNRKLNEEYGADLKSFDIHRARDYGMASYNDLREYCGLPRAYQWADFLHEIAADKVELLQQFYASPDDVDLSIGGSLEAHAPESQLGPTFQCIVARQFLTARISDRFFFENENLLSGFSQEQLAELRKATMSGLYCNNGDNLQYIQPNAFIVPNPRNTLRSCNFIPKVDLSKWKTQPSNHY